MPYIGKTPTVGNFQVCDAISVVNGQAAYTLQVGGANVAPESANHMLVSLNGILQKPGSSFTISGSTMTFASNLATGDVIDFVQILGNVLDLGTPSDGTITTAKLVDNAVTAAKATGFGKIAQVVTATDTSYRSTTSTSFVTASSTLTVDITPSATTSKVLVICTGNFNAPDGNDAFAATIYRDSTNLGHSTSGLAYGNSVPGVSANHYPTTMTILDSPSSTSAITYRMYMRCDNADSDGSTTATLGNTLAGTSTAPIAHIIAMEVLA